MAEPASWVCVQHRADCGSRVRTYLWRNGIVVHWPRFVERIARRDDVLRPLFPGYMFAKPGNISWQHILDVPNVIRVLGVKETGEPYWVPDAYVDNLIEMAGGIDSSIPPLEDVVSSWRPGKTTVRITDGPWRGLSGLLWEDRGKDRVKVLLCVLGAARPVSVPRSSVVETEA